jgi:hypothetical protein
LKECQRMEEINESFIIKKWRNWICKKNDDRGVLSLQKG